MSLGMLLKFSRLIAYCGCFSSDDSDDDDDVVVMPIAAAAVSLPRRIVTGSADEAARLLARRDSRRDSRDSRDSRIPSHLQGGGSALGKAAAGDALCLQLQLCGGSMAQL